MARYNIVFNVDYKTMAFCRRTFAPRLSTIRTMPIRRATQRPQMMAMDAATGYGDSMIVEVKYSEPRTIYSNCNINFIKLIYDTRFLMSPKCILPPVAFIQLVDAARQNHNYETDSGARYLSNGARVETIGRVLCQAPSSAMAFVSFCVQLTASYFRVILRLF